MEKGNIDLEKKTKKKTKVGKDMPVGADTGHFVSALGALLCVVSLLLPYLYILSLIFDFSPALQPWSTALAHASRARFARDSS